MTNATGEIETIVAEKSIFNYHIVNDELAVSQRIAELLISGLYPEELFEANTEKLIEETPVFIEPKGSSLLRKVAIFAVVGGLVAFGAYKFRQSH